MPKASYLSPMVATTKYWPCARRATRNSRLISHRKKDLLCYHPRMNNRDERLKRDKRFRKLGLPITVLSRTTDIAYQRLHAYLTGGSRTLAADELERLDAGL